MNAPLRASLFALLATAVLVPGYLVLAGGDPSAPVGSGAPVFTLREGQRGSYEIAVQSCVRMPTGVEVRQDLSAILELCVLEVAATGTRVGLRLASLQLALDGRRDAVREAALMAPFIARFDGGSIGALTFPDGLCDETRRQLDSLLRIFQCAVPPDAEPLLVVEQDGLGRYRARYQRSGKGAVERRKAAYLSGMAPGGVPCEVRVLRATGSFTVADGGPWLSAADVAEQFELSSMGNVAAHITQQARLRLRGTTQVVPPQDWLDGAAQAVESSRELERAALPEVPARAATAQERQAFRSALEAFVAGSGTDMAAMYALARKLAELPELAEEVEQVLRRPQLVEGAVGGLCHALELAGTVPGQEALAHIGLDPMLRPGLRFGAAVALGGTARPTAEAEAALFRLASDRDPSLAAAAWLALGNVGSNLRDQDAGRYQALRAVLADQVARAAEGDAAVVALRAIGNTQDPQLVDAALGRIADASAPVRAAAAETAGAIGGVRAAAALELALRSESDPQVRVSMVTGLVSTGDRDLATATCASLIEQEQHEAARFAMARVLADNLQDHPELRPVLQRLLANETSAPTIAYVAGRLYREQGR